MTFEEKFESLKKNFVKVNAKKLGADFAIQFTMTDEDCGGTFYIEYKEGNFNVMPYDYFDNTAAVSATANEIAKLYKGTVSKSLVIGGDDTVVIALSNAYKAEKKAPVKKAAPKKATPAKKEVVKAAPKKAEPKKTEVKKAEPAKKVEAKKATPAKAETKPVAKKAETKPATKVETKPAVKKTEAKKATKPATKSSAK